LSAGVVMDTRDQLPLNLTTQNPSVLSPNSTFRQYFIYFIVRKVN